jgi:hypothetical protein
MSARSNIHTHVTYSPPPGLQARISVVTFVTYKPSYFRTQVSEHAKKKDLKIAINLKFIVKRDENVSVQIYSSLLGWENVQLTFLHRAAEHRTRGNARVNALLEGAVLQACGAGPNQTHTQLSLTNVSGLSSQR